MFNSRMGVSTKIVLIPGFFLSIIGAPSSVWPQANRDTLAQGSRPTILLPSSQRVLFDSSAFGYGVPVPYSDSGYLISRKVETFTPGTPNVMVYGKDGQKVREAAIWFPESNRVAITSAAVTPDGRIVASGEADKADGTRAPFIALTDLSGKVTDAIQTKDFYPTYVCVAPDRTVWSFGATWWDDINHRPLPGDLLRHFDFAKGQLGGYLPRSTFPDRTMPETTTFIRCSSKSVAIFAGPQNAYVLLPYGANLPRLYSASPPTALTMTGFAVLGSGKAYGVLVNRDAAADPAQGLYSIQLDEATKTVLWSPIDGAVGPRTSPGTVLRLWGNDGEFLVLGRAHDPGGVAAVYWAAVNEK